MSKLTVAGFAFTFVLTSAVVPALAVDERNVAPGLSAAGSPLGLHGADPVALLANGKSVLGSAKLTSVHDGVAYYFASQKNLDAFAAAPAKFAPQNGGFCTFGVAVGKKFDGDPRYAAVLDDRIYVFLNQDIYKKFLEDKAGTIAKASANWPRIEHSSAQSL